MNYTAFFGFILILFVLFTGDPDLHDSLKAWLTAAPCAEAKR